MTVRAKMRCSKVKEVHSELFELQLVAVADSSGENASWSKYTPSGEINLNVTNVDAVKQFEVGKSYYIDFTPAE